MFHKYTHESKNIYNFVKEKIMKLKLLHFIKCIYVCVCVMDCILKFKYHTYKQVTQRNEFVDIHEETAI